MIKSILYNTIIHYLHFKVKEQKGNVMIAINVSDLTLRFGTTSVL